MKVSREPCQHGPVRKVPRSQGFAWEFRFYITALDGKRKLKVLELERFRVAVPPPQCLRPASPASSFGDVKLLSSSLTHHTIFFPSALGSKDRASLGIGDSLPETSPVDRRRGDQKRMRHV
jgi:hypothetical protein